MRTNEQSRRRTTLLRWFTRCAMVFVSIIMLYPLIWNIYSAFKTNTEFLANPFSLPTGLAWDNFSRAIEASNLFNNVLNSLIVVLVALAVVVLCVIPCACCLARFRFPGSRLIEGVYMAAIFVQATVIMIPLFEMMNSMRLLNNRVAIGVLYGVMQFPFAVFLLTGFMRSVPRDYEEAAQLDGCGNFRILMNIYVPMAKPGIITVCMITTMAAWNEYPVALVMLTDPSKQTLPVGIAMLYERQRYATDWGALFAALVLALIPTVVIFLIGQKQLIQGMSLGGIKG